MLVAFVLVSAPVFWLVSYNSGYGFDQLEYLIIGRSLTEGYPLYYWFPSKSFGIYALVALLYSLGVSFGHVSVALIATAMYCLIVTATYLVVRVILDPVVALVAAVLIAACAAFMELVFLQPDGFVYLSGLLAFYLVLCANPSQRSWRILLAGAAVAVGTYFKSVAGLYLLPIIMFVAITMRTRGSSNAAVSRAMLMMLVAFSVAFSLPAAYFAISGHLDAFWRWTVTFPLFDYSANTFYLRTLYTKLLFFHALVIGCLLLSLRPKLRTEVYSTPAAVLALALGVFAYGAILKTQAAHYCFPGAAFLSIFSAVVLTAQARLSARVRANGLLWTALGAAVLALVAVLSAYLYLPHSLKRLAQLRDFATEDDALRRLVWDRVPPGNQMLILTRWQSTRWYWLSHRYPPPPFLNTAEQTVRYIRHHPSSLLGLLDVPGLALVGFNPGEPEMDDLGFGSRPGDDELFELLRRRVERRFVRINVSIDEVILWIPRRSAPFPNNSSPEDH
jgi:hypothetical protein